MKTFTQYILSLRHRQDTQIICYTYSNLSSVDSIKVLSSIELKVLNVFTRFLAVSFESRREKLNQQFF